MRALVIDDSKAIRMIVGKFLKEIGFQIFEAANGKEGVDQLKELGAVEVVLVDWNMPVMNGLEFVKLVRADEQYNSMQLMMVTTETEMAQVIDALNAGANEYAMKPFTKEILVEKLQLMGLA